MIVNNGQEYALVLNTIHKYINYTDVYMNVGMIYQLSIPPVRFLKSCIINRDMN